MSEEQLLNLSFVRKKTCESGKVQSERDNKNLVPHMNQAFNVNKELS